MNTHTKLNITEEELNWVKSFLERNEPGLFSFSPRQLEVLAVYNGHLHSSK